MESIEILNQPIHLLDLSELFKEQSDLMGFATLADVIQLSPEILAKKKGFTYGWLLELSIFLSEHKLLYLLQPLPGKTDDQRW